MSAGRESTPNGRRPQPARAAAARRRRGLAVLAGAMLLVLGGRIPAAPGIAALGAAAMMAAAAPAIPASGFAAIPAMGSASKLAAPAAPAARAAAVGAAAILAAGAAGKVTAPAARAAPAATAPLASPAAAGAPGEGAKRRPLVIGVTLHPYYSWTRNVVGDLPGFEVRAILPGEIDAGDYQPRPEDIRKLADVDALVVNGIGHDDFIFPMLAASGNRRAVVVRPNDATPQIRSAHGTAVNSHTFISFTNAVQQTYAIEKALAALRPEAAPALLRNAESYARRLRLIKARAAARLADAAITRVVTVHDGYGYLLQEFGLEVAGVVQPAHGLTPSAAELRDMVELLRRERVQVVFSEESFPPRLLAVLRDEAGVRVYTISHIASGAYTADKFEREMQKNVDTMVEALVTAAPRKAGAPAPRPAAPGRPAATPGPRKASPGAAAPGVPGALGAPGAAAPHG